MMAKLFTCKHLNYIMVNFSMARIALDILILTANLENVSHKTSSKASKILHTTIKTKFRIISSS